MFFTITAGRIGYQHFFDKTTVLQEARVFNESPINARKCRALLTKILYLISLGETFGTTEATELFFSVTKLFQSKDVCSSYQNLPCASHGRLDCISLTSLP